MTDICPFCGKEIMFFEVPWDIRSRMLTDAYIVRCRCFVMGCNLLSAWDVLDDHKDRFVSNFIRMNRIVREKEGRSTEYRVDVPGIYT